MRRETRVSKGIGCLLLTSSLFGCGYALSLQQKEEQSRPHSMAQAATLSRDVPEQTDKAESEADKIADGSHCINGWDLTFPPLKEAVRAQLRNPDSFQHISTSWSHMGKDGKFGLVMRYRAQNGFGGMNVEAVGALVDARSCHFTEVSAQTLVRRMMTDPSTS